MRFVKMNKGLLSLCHVFLFVCVLFIPHRALSQGKDYTVEVAALRSQECAAVLTSGLLARGFEAYWIKANQPEYGIYYRVRVGRFQDLDTARAYAEDLLDSGLLDTCSIAVYEPSVNALFKTSAPARSGMQAGVFNTPLAASCPVKLPDDDSSEATGDPVDMIAAISKNKWLLSASTSIVYSPPASKSVSPYRDAVFLMRAVDKYRWRLSIEINRLVQPEPPPKPSLSAQSVVPNPNLGSSLSAIVSSVVARNSVASVVRPVPNNKGKMTSFDAAASGPVNTPIPIIAEPSIPTISRVSSNSPLRALSSLPPPRLQGAMEMLDGQLMMRIKNLDLRRSFNGVARVTLSDDKELTDVPPMPFFLQPNEEKVVPMYDSPMPFGDWMLMVYDERQAVQLVRSAPFGQRPAPIIAANQNATNQETEPGQWKLVEPSENAPSSNGLPNVTGTFDATGNAKPNQTNTGQANSGTPTNGPNSQQTAPPVMPGQVIVNPRYVASTADNVTIELDVAAPQPLSYIKVLLRSGNYQDERYALLSETNGRIPFLIPAKEARGDFSFEIKNETGGVLASGAGDFRQLGRGN